MSLTHDHLTSVLHFEPATGHFHWRQRVAICVVAGDRAGRTAKRGYLQIKIGYRAYLSHRLAWFYVHGKWPSGEIDHINGDPQDNRISNLRDVSTSVNQLNRHKKASNKLGFQGLYSKRGRFGARIKVNGRQTYLGVYDTAEEAAQAYESARHRFTLLEELQAERAAS